MPFAAHSPAFKLAGLACAALLLAACPAAPGPARDPGAPEAELRCPQPRDTQEAPPTYQGLENPLDDSAENRAQGQALYLAARPGGSCADCHGQDGDGNGAAGRALVPPPRP